jgi:peptide chain release factor 1
VLEKKIEAHLERLKNVEAALAEVDFVADQKRYKELAQEHAFLADVKKAYDKKKAILAELASNEELGRADKDYAFQTVLAEDNERLKKELEVVDRALENLVIPPGPNDNDNTILELRAGTGGQEAGLFVGDCVRMYTLFANHMGWKTEGLSATESDLGGFKEYVMVLSGKGVYRYLQFEGGTHRVQRVPQTEAQGRIHTSTITVAVLLETKDDAGIVINEQDLRIETTRSSGAGGQHVNKTDSAVRITHIPSGVVVFCQEERSQHKNKEKAMRLLRIHLAEAERIRKKEETDSKRLAQVGGAERAEKIRTYNFPQNRLTDHRINLTKYNLDQIMNGDLEDICLSLITHFQNLT